MGVDDDPAHEAGDPHPVCGRFERVACAATEQLRAPTQAGIRRVTQLWMLRRAAEI